MKTLRPKTGRKPTIHKAAAGTFEGTEALLTTFISESAFHPPSWRPLRSAVVRAADAMESPCWMTTEEFAAWAGTFTQGKIGTIQRETGIGRARRVSILAGDPIRRTEALAIAHYRAGLPLPIPLEAPEFRGWYAAHFAAVRMVAVTLKLDKVTISDAANGYGINRGQRVQRKPGIALVRALDWLLRVGVVSPYGRRTMPVYPGQEV